MNCLSVSLPHNRDTSLKGLRNTALKKYRLLVDILKLWKDVEHIKD